MMATFTGIVPISGSAQFDIGGPFELASFNSESSQLYDVGLPFVTYTGLVLEGDSFFSPNVVMLNTMTSQIYGVDATQITVYDGLVLDGFRDFTFTPRTTASGAITVLNFGFGTGFTFTPPSYVNRRFFPTAVADATLFPGDVPRGSPLN